MLIFSVVAVEAQDNKKVVTDTTFIIVQKQPHRTFAVYHIYRPSKDKMQFFVYDSFVHAYIGAADDRGLKYRPQGPQKDQD